MMKWIGWLVLVALCVFLLRRSGKGLLPFQKELAAATNALLTEHYLAAHDLAAVSPFSKALAYAVCDACRASGFPNATAEFIAEQFNGYDRFTQLNVIALALHHAGTAPLLPREFWRPSRNPFLAKRDPGSIGAVSARLHHDHGVKIDIGETALRLVDGHIEQAPRPLI
jgi:hypothetical protein